MGFSRHEWPLMCCVCFSGITPETCAVDSDGVKWDVCTDPHCIEGAGIVIGEERT